MSDEHENPNESLKHHGSAGIWATVIAIALVLYVISPPFVVKLMFSVSRPHSPPGAFAKSIEIFYWPLGKLMDTGLCEPLERFYDWEAKLLGLK
jgi:hypothetical protein